MRNGHSTGSYNSDICNGAGHQSCPAWTTQNRYLQFRSGFSQHRYCLCPSLVGRIFWLTIHPKSSGISTGDMVLNQLRRACRRRRRTCPIWMERYCQNHCRFFSNFCCQFYRFSIVLIISFVLENETPCGSAGISAGHVSQASFSGCKGV